MSSNQYFYHDNCLQICQCGLFNDDIHIHLTVPTTGQKLGPFFEVEESVSNVITMALVRQISMDNAIDMGMTCIHVFLKSYESARYIYEKMAKKFQISEAITLLKNIFEQAIEEEEVMAKLELEETGKKVIPLTENKTVTMRLVASR